MTQQMTAAVLYGKEQLEIETVDVPKIGPGDVLVRVRAALTCGTDVKVFRRGYHARMIAPPALFGHELAGDIVAMGENVTGFQDRPARDGGQLRAVRRMLLLPPRPGKPVRGSAVQQRRLRRIHPHPGAHRAEEPAPVRDHVGYQDAALAEPLACVLRGLEESGLRAGDTVAVIGLGPIGMMFVRLAKAVYGARVIAIGRRQPQLDRAARMGADELIVNTDGADVVGAVKGMTEGRGADVVIEAVGLPELWQLAARLLRRGGVVNFFGGCASRHRGGPGYQPAALFRADLQGQLPPHAGADPQGARSGRAAATSRPRISSTAWSRSPICSK